MLGCSNGLGCAVNQEMEVPCGDVWGAPRDFGSILSEYTPEGPVSVCYFPFSFEPALRRVSHLFL